MSFTRFAALAIAVLAGSPLGCAPARSTGAPDTPSTATARDGDNPNESIEKLLQKSAPGAIIRRTESGGIAITLRGSQSLLGNDKPPLYVLNGLPFQPDSDGALTGIDPRDIESIKVLSSAESGLYGIEGANGVIVITTKQAKKRN